MEYRKLPRGNKKLSVLGLGTGSIYQASDGEIENIIRTAIEHGINYFDLCAGGGMFTHLLEGRSGVSVKKYFLRFISVQLTEKPESISGPETLMKYLKPWNGNFLQ